MIFQKWITISLEGRHLVLTLLASCIWNLGNKGCLILCSSVYVWGIFNQHMIYTISMIYTFTHFFPTRNNFLSSARTFSLNFNNVRKSVYFLAWDALCNRNIFIEFIMRFQLSKCLAYDMWENWFKIHMIPVFKILFWFNENLSIGNSWPW